MRAWMRSVLVLREDAGREDKLGLWVPRVERVCPHMAAVARKGVGG
jgi:hypothetical protein